MPCTKSARAVNPHGCNGLATKSKLQRATILLARCQETGTQSSESVVPASHQKSQWVGYRIAVS